MHTLRRKWLLLALLAMTSSLAGAAAKDDQREPSIEVRYGDLDLRAPEGVRTLERRIANAANQVCGTDQFPTITVVTHYRNCVRVARDNALAQVRWPSK